MEVAHARRSLAGALGDFSMTRSCKGEFDLKSSLGEHVNQGVNAEEFDFALHEVAHAGLTHVKQSCGFGLLQPSRLDNPVQLNHQVGPDAKMRGLRRGEAEVLEDVTARSGNFRGHGVPSPSSKCVDSLAALVCPEPSQFPVSVSSSCVSRTHEARRRLPPAWRRRTLGARAACESATQRHQSRRLASASSWLAQAHPVPGATGIRLCVERQPGSYEYRLGVRPSNRTNKEISVKRRA